jgi:endoglucanase
MKTGDVIRLVWRVVLVCAALSVLCSAEAFSADSNTPQSRMSMRPWDSNAPARSRDRQMRMRGRWPRNRWQQYLKESDQWYRSDKGRRIADNVLSWQSAYGSWPKNMDTTAERFSGDPNSLKGTFDNNATVNEIRFLSKAFRATGDERYKQAVVKGIDDILKAQYPTGGWPQFYPPDKAYHRYITFNDNCMLDLMQILREVATNDDYGFLGAEMRKAAQVSFDRGLQCILKCQIVVNGKRTVWCQQHDEMDYSPRHGRAFEPVALCSLESVGILELLMSLDNPSSEVRAAIDGAAQWFESAKITGKRLVWTRGDRVIVDDPNAPPIWARFYEIGTNRPIFEGRDSVIKYNMAEIEQERRAGYAWYGRWPQTVAPDYAAWKLKYENKPKTDSADANKGKAFEVNKKLGRGINLGNALEAPSEGKWGVTLKAEWFRIIKEAGFDSVRVPIRWSAHAMKDSPYTIDEEFFKRVDWVVKNAQANNLCVVINVHHYEEIFDDPNGQRERLVGLWKQIAERYKDTPETVVFELLNEPHNKLDATKWNAILAEALEEVRSSNPDRVVMIGPGRYNNIDELEKLELPADDRNIIVSCHYYSPFKFTHQGAEWVGDKSKAWLGTKWTGSAEEKSAIERDFDKASQWGQANARPINIGEFGAYNKADMDSRALYTSFVARTAEQRGFSWMYWEFCSGFGAYDKDAGKWREPLLKALVAPAIKASGI